MPRPRSIGNNSVIKKREISTACQTWTMIWPNATSIGTAILSQLKTRLQLRPPKSIGSDGVSSKIGIHTVLRDSPTINLNAIYRDTLIYSRPSSST